MTMKAVIFDLDGVITDTAVYHFQAWKKLADELGIPFDEDDNERLKGVSRLESLNLILERGDTAYTDAQKDAMMARKNNDYVALIETLAPDQVFPGVREAFAAIRTHGMTTGLASASKNAQAIIEKLGIASEFDFVADAAAVAHSKPAPDIFLAAAKGLNVQPSECIGVEDAAAGIESILSAGMFAVGIGDAHILSRAALVFPDMRAFDIDTVLATMG